MSTFLTTVPEFSFTDWQVCLLGVGTVFVGLIGVILVCFIIGAITSKIGGKKEDVQASDAKSSQTAQNAEIQNREEFVAAISAALAEYMGEDVNSFRIVSIKKI